MQLIAFKKQFDNYSDEKNDIESSLLRVKSDLEKTTSNQKIIDNFVRIQLFITCPFCDRHVLHLNLNLFIFLDNQIRVRNC